MKLSRVLVVFGLLLTVVLFMAACGGGGSSNNGNTTQPLVITTTSPLPQATINSPYSVVLQGSGGTGTYVWSVASGSPPAGLTLNSMTGQLSGSPTVSGTFSFTAGLMDGAGHSATASLSIFIEGALIISCNSCVSNGVLPYASVGVPYSATLSASGGQTPYNWCVQETNGTCDNGAGGGLPPGLTISTSTDGNFYGIISGTPTSQPAAPLTVTVEVSDSETVKAVGSEPLTLVVFSILTKTVPNGFINQAYKAANGQPVDVIAAGGSGSQSHPYHWSVTSGSLPPGLSLCGPTSTPVCAISGTPTQLGVSNFTITVMDGETPPAAASQALTIDVTDPALTITTTTLPAGNINLPYSSILQATGGNGTNTWSIASGNLPAGLNLNASTGAITGTPTAQGMSSFMVQVQDTENPPQVTTAALSITVNQGIGNGTLNGIYVFSFSGYAGQNGSPVVMAGAFTADGNGGLSGEFDLNNGVGETNAVCSGGLGNGPQPQTLASGSGYSIQANGLGTMTLVASSGTYNFSIAIRPDGSGTFIQDNSDPSTRGSGVITPQASGVTIGQLFGKFAIGLNGADASHNRYAAAGQMVVEDTNGDVGVSALDVDDDGNTTQQTFRGTLSTSVDSLGRGCFGTFNFNGQHNSPCGTAGGGPNAYCYAYYLVSQSSMVLISTDPFGGSNNAPVTLWSGLRQSSSGTGFTNQSLAVPTVLEMNALDTSGSSDVVAGLFVGQGVSTHTCPTMDSATFTFDSNQSGSGPGQQVQTATGTYCIASSTGRVTLTGFSGWGTSPPVLYLGGADPGFIVGTDFGVTSGVVETQQIQSGKTFNDASISGSYWGGTYLPAASIVTDSVTELFADGGGDVIGTQNTSGPNGPGGPTQLTLSYSVDSTGRAVVTQNGNEFGVLYVVGPNKLIMVPSGSNPALNVFLSGQTN